MPYTREKEAAIEAVRRAATVCESVRAAMVHAAMEKADRSPVTVADFASQAIVGHALAAAFPEDAIVAEEDSADLVSAGRERELGEVVRHVATLVPGADAAAVCAWIDRGRGAAGAPAPRRFWTLDPIDGTKGFLRDDQYAVALALIEDGLVRVGALACPRLDGGMIFAAVDGGGAWSSPVAGSDDMRELARDAGSHPSALRLVESVESRHGDHERQERIAAALGLTTPPMRMDSQAKYGIVARGDAALYLRLPSPATPDYREKIWDHAAGMLLVVEGGGVVTDTRGHPLRFDLGETLRENIGVVATRGIDHAAVIAAIV